MKKLLALASVVSAVALASGAYADSSTLTLTGTVSPSVNITAAVTTGTNVNENGTTLGARNINLSSFETNGIVNAASGTTTFTVNSNAVFVASLYSDNGHLGNGTSTVGYNVSVGDQSRAASTATSTVPVTKVYASGSSVTVPVGYTISAGTSPISQGQYSDVLHFTVAAQ